MGNLFNYDGGVMTFLSKLFDMVYLSVLYTLFCIPIVTIGPATAALYYTTVKGIRRDRGYVFRNFWHSFKLNFKLGTVAWMIVLLLGILFSFNLRFAYANLKTKMGTPLLCIYCAITFVFLCTSSYIFPVLSRFTMTLKNLLKMSLFMGIRHLPSTIGMILLFALGVFLVLFINPILIFVVPALITYLYSFLMERILKKYMNEEEITNEEKADEWYLE